MSGTARAFFIAALVFLMCGVTLGLAMAIGGDHSAAPAHAHINLAGWVSLALFGYFYQLYPAIGASRAGRIHLYLQVVSTTAMCLGVTLIYTGQPQFEPLAAVGSLGFAAGVLLFARNVFTAFSRGTMTAGSIAAE